MPLFEGICGVLNPIDTDPHCKRARPASRFCLTLQKVMCAQLLRQNLTPTAGIQGIEMEIDRDGLEME